MQKFNIRDQSMILSEQHVAYTLLSLYGHGWQPRFGTFDKLLQF